MSARAIWRANKSRAEGAAPPPTDPVRPRANPRSDGSLCGGSVLGEWLPGRRPCRGWNQSSRRLMNFCSLMNTCPEEDPMEEGMRKAQTCQGRNTIAKLRGAILNNRLKGWKLKTEQNKAPHHPGCLGEPFTLINAASQGHWCVEAGTTTRGLTRPTAPWGANYFPGLILPFTRPFRSRAAAATARNKSSWMEGPPTGSWELDVGPKSTDLLHKKEAPAQLLPAGSTDCVGFWLGL